MSDAYADALDDALGGRHVRVTNGEITLEGEIVALNDGRDVLLVDAVAPESGAAHPAAVVNGATAIVAIETGEGRAPSVAGLEGGQGSGDGKAGGGGDPEGWDPTEREAVVWDDEDDAEDSAVDEGALVGEALDPTPDDESADEATPDESSGADGEDLVFVASGKHGLSKYHRDEGCQYIGKIDALRKRPLSVLGAAEPCSVCCPEAPDPEDTGSEADPRPDETEDQTEDVDRDETVQIEGHEDADEEELGTYEVRDYSSPMVALGSAVANWFDADRVTVRDMGDWVALVSGESEGWPDYKVGERKVQITGAGVEVIDVEPGDEVRAVAVGDVVRLEPADADETRSDSSADGTGDPVDADEYWCGYCGGGPLESERAVRDHHEAEGHPGMAVVKLEDPALQTESNDDRDGEGTVSKPDGGGVATTNAQGGASRTCQNCGSTVSKAYARVHAPDEEQGPRVCPSCPDKVRDGAEVREARSPRRTDR